MHVVDDIPVTTWYRPNPAALRAAGSPPPGAAIWRRGYDPRADDLDEKGELIRADR